MKSRNTKRNGYFQVLVYQGTDWVDTKKYKTMNRAYDFKAARESLGYTVKVKWVNLNTY
jgi:hypothetical protein